MFVNKIGAKFIRNVFVAVRVAAVTSLITDYLITQSHQHLHQASRHLFVWSVWWHHSSNKPDYTLSLVSTGMEGGSFWVNVQWPENRCCIITHVGGS